MTDQTSDVARLDWRDLVVAGAHHWCGCDYCPMDGEMEPDQWPILVPMRAGDDLYITDRFVMIRADLAPVPDNYEGDVLAETEPPNKGFLVAPFTDQSADGLVFRASSLLAVERVGGRLRLLDQPPGADGRSRAVGVIDPSGNPIGWTMAAINNTESAHYRTYEEADRD